MQHQYLIKTLFLHYNATLKSQMQRFLIKIFKATIKQFYYQSKTSPTILLPIQNITNPITSSNHKIQHKINHHHTTKLITSSRI